MAGSWSFRTAVGLSLLSYFLLAYFVERHEHLELTLCFIVASYGFWTLWRQRNIIDSKIQILLAVGFRVIFIFSLPSLSDDVFRFIWDGHVWLSGIHPFEYTPKDLLNSAEILSPALSDDLFSLLNSQERYTVYPPVAQFIFYNASFIGGNSILTATIAIRLFLLLMEVLTITLLPKVLRSYGIDPNNALLYTLNPLVIVEIVGNLHFEGAWIAFILICLLLLLRKQVFSAAFAYALAICTKLIPLLFAPLFVRYLKMNDYLKFGVFTVLICVILFLPLLNQSLFFGMSDSLDLYFRKFEFNASIYYVVRWMGWQSFGYNIIQTAGPALAKLVIVFMAYFLLFLNPSRIQLPEAMLWTLTVYLLLSTTVHPWYITPLVFLATFTRYRYAIIWSLLAPLTYLGYTMEGYHELQVVVVIEYTVVLLMMIWEIFSSRYLIELYNKVRA